MRSTQLFGPTVQRTTINFMNARIGDSFCAIGPPPLTPVGGGLGASSFGFWILVWGKAVATRRIGRQGLRQFPWQPPMGRRVVRRVGRRSQPGLPVGRRVGRRYSPGTSGVAGGRWVVGRHGCRPAVGRQLAVGRRRTGGRGGMPRRKPASACGSGNRKQSVVACARRREGWWAGETAAGSRRGRPPALLSVLPGVFGGRRSGGGGFPRTWVAAPRSPSSSARGGCRASARGAWPSGRRSEGRRAGCAPSL